MQNLRTSNVLFSSGHLAIITIAVASGFYRAMLCIRGTSHGPASVRLSVRHNFLTSRCSIETAKRIELVFGM